MPIATASDIEALEARPIPAEALAHNTYAAIAATARRTPSAKALTFFMSADAFERAHTWTYAELLADITRAANMFRAFGVSRENPVAFVLPNLPETHFTIWGGEAVGVAFAINPLLDAAYIAELLRAARPRVLVMPAPKPTPGDLWTRLSPLLADVPELRVVAWVDVGHYLGAAPTQSAAQVQGTDFPFSVVDFRSELRKQPADPLSDGLSPGPQDPSSYFCTGGTTGLPKIAVRTHGNEVFDAWSVGRMLGEPSAPRTFFCGLPLFHVNAQLVTGLLPWMSGDHVVLGTPEGYRGSNVLARFWQIVAHYRVSLFSGVPTIYAALLGTEIGDNDVSSLDLALCGAAPMPARLIDAFEAKTGVKVLEGYGLTEAACVSSVNPAAGERRTGSIGLRIPYQMMRVVILDDGQQFERMAAIDEVGIIAIRGPNVFLGYLNNDNAAGLWVEIDGERWLNTGDLGRQDSDGYFWLAGRKKELIIRGGHNIDPRIIEEALTRHPSVALAAAVGSPDPHAGEVPVAYVQLKPGAVATEQELLEFAAGTIPERAAVPKRLRIAAALPMTAVGKLFKPALHQMEIEETIRSEAGRVGVTVVDLRLDRDNRVGLIARVRVAAGAHRLREALERFTFKVEVT